MDFDISRPIFLQIMEEVKRKAIRGELKAGERIPSVREFAKELKVNPNTVAKAYYELERERFLFTKRGQGTFITEDKGLLEREEKKIIRERIRGFLKELRKLGMGRDEIEKVLKEAIKEEKWKH